MNRWLSPLAVAVLALTLLLPADAAGATVKQAVENYKAGKYGQALNEFTELANARPGEPMLHYYLALCHQALNHRTQAKAEYAFVSQRGDATLRAHAAKGLATLEQGRASRGAAAPAAATTASAPAVTASSQPANGPGKVKKIIKFSATWCGPCQVFAPVYEATKPKYRDINFQELDLDDPSNAGLKQQYSVNSVPRLIFLDSNNKVLYNGGADSSPGAFDELIAQYR